MKNIFTKIWAIAATSAAFSVAIAVGTNNPAQAIGFRFSWQDDANYSAIGSFSYDETIAPTILSESGIGATNFLQSLEVSFFDPSNNLLNNYSTVAGGVSESNFFKFNFDTTTQTLFGPFDVGGGMGVIGEYFLQGTIGSSLSLIQDIDQIEASRLVDRNSGSIQVSQVPEPASVLGLLALGAMGAGSVLKKKPA